jgi:hypothetical protein
MSLDISKLEHVRGRGKKTIARCPACAEAGEDRKGEHLLINEDGSFGCIIHPGNSPEAKAHRKQIFALCGDREIRPLKVSRRSKYRPNNVLAVLLGREGRISAGTGAIQKQNIFDLVAHHQHVSKIALPDDIESKHVPAVLKPVEKVSISAACGENNVPAVPELPERKCVICGNPYNGAPESEYCGNECASDGHLRWISEGRNPSPARTKFLRRQCRQKAVADRKASEDFNTRLRDFEKRIRRKPDDDERPSIIRAIIDWHNAHPEMRLKNAKEQWQLFQQQEAAVIYANTHNPTRKAQRPGRSGRNDE